MQGRVGEGVHSPSLGFVPGVCCVVWLGRGGLVSLEDSWADFVLPVLGWNAEEGVECLSLTLCPLAGSLQACP